MTETTQTTDGEGTAVAERTTPSEDEIAQIRRAGELRKERKKEIRETARALKGIQFGGIDGAHMSQETRWQVAKMCQVTGANPLTHIDILGDRIYHNADYWSDVLTTHPRYHRHEQREISESTETTLREQAEKKEARSEEVLEKADALDSDELRREAKQLYQEALDLRAEADDLELARSKYGVPEWATDAVETTIYKIAQSAPLEDIEAGEVDVEPFLVTVSEANWAGGKGEYKDEHHPNNKSFSRDPIGDANPAKTARTRSLRRAARRAFSEWMEPYQEQIERAEEAAAEDFEVLRAEAASRPAPGERQAIASGNGEPEATTSSGAKDLPVTGEVGSETSEAESEPSGGEEEPEPDLPQADATPPEENGEEDGPSTEELIDRERRAYFANLRDGPGIEDSEERHAWQEEHDLPESTKDWSLEQWRRANSILTAEAKASYKQACNALGVDPDEYARDMLDRPAKMISDFEQLTDKLSAEADQEAAEVSEQEELL